MKTVDAERWALLGISVVTVLSGAGQAIAPSATLAPLKVSDDAATRQLFGTIGMFMVISGATLGQELLRRPHDPDPAVLGLAAAQKAGAAGAVVLGVKRGVFSPLALVVAGFDAISGALAVAHLLALRRG